MNVRRRSVLMGAGLLVLSGCAAPAPALAPPPEPDPSGLLAVEAGFGGRVGVFAVDTGTGATIGNRADERFLLCSTLKAPLAAAVLARSVGEPGLLTRLITYTEADLLEYAPVAEANLATGLTVAQLCEAAVTVSDNTAANLLLDVVGGPAGLTAFLRGTGDTVTRSDRTEPDLNVVDGEQDTTTPRAFAETLRALVLGDALPAAQRDTLTGWLVGNTTGDEQIRAGVPEGWRVGDKTGSGSQGERNDVAVLWPDGGAPIVLTVFTSPDDEENDQGIPTIAAVARETVAAFRAR